MSTTYFSTAAPLDVPPPPPYSPQSPPSSASSAVPHSRWFMLKSTQKDISGGGPSSKS